MFDNYLFVAAAIILLWLGLILGYIWLTRSQPVLNDEIEQLEQLLDTLEKPEG